jgi:hypothetical protein
MKNLFVLLLILLSFSNCLPQKASTESVRLDPKRPSAYVTFDHRGKRSPERDGESEDRIWLRFHNNTRWVLALRVLGMKAGSDLQKEERLREWQVSFDVRPIPGMAVKNTDIPIGYRITHKATLRLLDSGQSLLFSVPAECLDRNLAIFVGFSYDWEMNGDIGGDLSIVHEAPFWSSDLPDQ